MVRLFGSQNAVLMSLAWAANESQFYSSRFGQSRLNCFYQPKARYKNRPDSKLGSVRLEIAAQLKARFSARDSMTRLDLARAGHCRSGLGSPRLGLTRLGSARLATRGLTHLRSWLRLSLGLRIWTGKSTRCSTRLSSEFDSGSARGQVGDRLGTRDSGFGLAGLGRVGARFVSFRSEYS